MSLFKLIILILFCKTAYGEGYSILLNFNKNDGEKIYLSYYYFGNIYIKDSTMLDNLGQAKFENSKKLQPGIYQLYFNENRHFDFLLGEDQSFCISEDSVNNKITIEGSQEAQKFLRYMDFLQELKIRQRKTFELRNQYKQLNDSLQKFNTRLNDLDTKLTEFCKNEANVLIKTFYAKFVRANIPVIPLPKEIIQDNLQNDSLRWINEYNFRKSHFWDNFDLTDKRMWYTPMIKPRVSEYFNKILLQQPDTILSAAVDLIEQVQGNPDEYRNLISFILNNSLQSNRMGIENVFVAIAEKYYLNGQANWVNEKTLSAIRTEVFYRKNNLLGMNAEDLLLEDTEGHYQNLYQQSTPYTIVLFWEPECGHCKTEVPKLYNEVFLKAAPSLLSVFAVYTQEDKAAWIQFINDHQLHDWINVWDPEQTSNFQILYNVRTTPGIYILDKDKNIIAKNMSVENVRRILESRFVSFDN